MIDDRSKVYTTGLVSVGIPAYNRVGSLQRILNIATSQTYTNLEIIVSDNASSNNEVGQVIQQFSIKDPRVKFYKQPHNIGVLANAEFVLKQATGEYFTWFSDDDWRSPEFIETLVNELKRDSGINCAFCDYHEVYEDGTPALEYPKTHLEIFKPFTSKLRLKRVLSYFWQDGKLGKANMFYSVFRKVALDKLDLKGLSANYRLLNMDCLIVFSILQGSRIAIIPQAMCTLTCGNKKYYADNNRVKNGNSLWVKLANVWNPHKLDRVTYMNNTSSYIEKATILGLSLVKCMYHFYQSVYTKIILVNQTSRIKPQLNKINTNINQESVMHEFPNITLVAVATKEVEETLQAILYSCKNIKFGKVKLLANYTPFGLERSSEIQFHRIQKFTSMDEWCKFIIYNLNDYIDTEFALLIHADGFIVNPDKWQDEFLHYDYIGAPWSMPTDDFSYRDISGNIIRVGNSVSLRSKKLLELPIKLNLPWEKFHGNYHEDGFICTKNRHIYEANGIKFAPLDVAKYFSHESMIPEIQNIKPFAFHKWAGSNSIYPKFSHMAKL